MKALSALCPAGGATSVPAIANGRVTARHNGQRASDSENAEIQMYLSKLKDLVPFMPKNRKLSKLEVIQYVIDYICDLQTALETHPAAAQSPTPFEDFLNNNSTDLNSANLHLNNSNIKSQKEQLRTPLGVRQSPNQILENSHPASHFSSSTSATDLIFLQQFMNNAEKSTAERKSSSSPSSTSSSPAPSSC